LPLAVAFAFPQLTDENSTNGLLVNGVCKRMAVLEDGDCISFGGAFKLLDGQQPGPKVWRPIPTRFHTDKCVFACTAGEEDRADV